MRIFDTDILSDLLTGVPAVVARAATIPLSAQAISIISVEVVVRGQLNAIRTAASGRGKVPLPRVYDIFQRRLVQLAAYRLMSYTPAADAEFARLRALKVRIGTQDLRISAIALAQNAPVVTRNARDFTQVPGLQLEVWP